MLAVIGGANLLAKIGQESVLRAHAEATATQWVTYIERVVPELSEIASGTSPSNNALMFLAHGIDTSSVVGYRFYDRHGELQALGGAQAQDEFHLKRSQDHVATVLDTGEPYLDMDINSPTHSHDKEHAPPVYENPKPRSVQRHRTAAAHDMHAGMDHNHASGSSMAMPHTTFTLK